MSNVLDRHVVGGFAFALLVLSLVACGTVTEAPALTLTGLSPASGDATTRVTVTGHHIAEDATVLVCGEEATDLVVRNEPAVQAAGHSSIEFYPGALPGDAVCDVVVVQGVGEGAEAAVLKDAFVFTFEPLTLTGSSPGTGDGSTTVTVTGRNIAGDATVTVCHEAVSNLEILDAAGEVVPGDMKLGVEIRFNPPAGPAGAPSCDIVVNQGTGDTFETEFLDEVFVYDGL